MRQFNSLEEMIVWASQDVRPIREMSVPEAAEQTPRMLNNRGSYVGPWKNSKVPYLVEPAECLRLAAAAGALAVMKRGPMSGAEFADTVRAFADKHRGS